LAKPPQASMSILPASATIRRQQPDGGKMPSGVGQTSTSSSIPKAVLDGIQTGTMAYEYKGIPTWKDPFDLAIYPVLFWRARPAAIIEVGSNKGGSALWMADVTRNLGIACQIHSIDIEPVTGVTAENVTFHRGDARNLGAAFGPDFLNALPRPLLVIEDSSHDADTTYAVLTYFDAWLRPGEYIVIEDGILTDMGYAAAFGGGPLAAIERFLRSHGARYEIDRTYCDWFGRNATWNVNGYLRRVS
jgi:cephalosporin hydroxylase